MADLARPDRLCVEELLGMGDGYVMDLSNRAFAELVRDELGIDIDSAKYASRGTSKANRLRSLWDQAEPGAVARVLRALWDHREQRGWTPGDLVEPRPSVVRARYMAVVDRLERQAGMSDLEALSQFAEGATLGELIEAINRDVAAGAHAAALDRLHTYSCKRFAHLLQDAGLECTREEPLHSRVGKHVKHLNATRQLRSMTLQILKNSVGVLQAFNDVRNNASFAHDNEIVDADEARLIVDSVLSVLRFVERVSNTG
ncbi:abortive infection family protein [Sphingomonas sp. RHCKR7]|uniref:abortive infection family protein n=1 Tax=Sphingomonas folli TaxID=2862497 RepID=UPI001C6795AD|nr:abortive infection family protein [Sphingomonas folli]MBW6525268.1 abortive infection family protein [Sphingomonas folli]